MSNITAISLPKIAPIPLQETPQKKEEPTQTSNIEALPVELTPLHQNQPTLQHLIESTSPSNYWHLANKLMHEEKVSSAKNPNKKLALFHTTQEHYGIISQKDNSLSETYLQLCALWNLNPKELEKAPNFLRSYNAIQSLSSLKQQKQALSLLIFVHLSHNQPLKDSWNVLVTRTPKSSGKKKQHSFASALLCTPFFHLLEERQKKNYSNIFVQICKQAIFQDKSQQKILFSFLKSIQSPHIESFRTLNLLQSLPLSASRATQKTRLKKMLELLHLLSKSSKIHSALQCQSLKELQELFWGEIKNLPGLNTDEISSKAFYKAFMQHPDANALWTLAKSNHASTCSQFFQSVIQDKFQETRNRNIKNSNIIGLLPKLQSQIKEISSPHAFLKYMQELKIDDWKILMDGTWRLVKISDDELCLLQLTKDETSSDIQIRIHPSVDAETAIKKLTQVAQSLELSLLEFKEDKWQHLYQVQFSDESDYEHDMNFYFQSVSKEYELEFHKTLSDKQLEMLSFPYMINNFLNFRYIVKTLKGKSHPIWTNAFLLGVQNNLFTPYLLSSDSYDEDQNWKFATWSFYFRNDPVTKYHKLLPNDPLSQRAFHLSILSSDNTVYNASPYPTSSSGQSLLKSAKTKELHYAAYLRPDSFFKNDLSLLPISKVSGKDTLFLFDICRPTTPANTYAHMPYHCQSTTELFPYILHSVLNDKKNRFLPLEFEDDFYDVCACMDTYNSDNPLFQKKRAFMQSPLPKEAALNFREIVLQYLENQSPELESEILRNVKQNCFSSLCTLKQIDASLPQRLIYKLAFISNVSFMPLMKKTLKTLPQMYRFGLAHFFMTQWKKEERISFKQLLDCLGVEDTTYRHMLTIKHCETQKSALPFLDETVDFNDTPSLYPIISRILNLDGGKTVLESWIRDGLKVDEDSVLVWLIAKHSKTSAEKAIGNSCYTWSNSTKYQWVLAKAAESSILDVDDPFTQIPDIQNRIIKYKIYTLWRNQSSDTNSLTKRFPEHAESIDSFVKLGFLNIYSISKKVKKLDLNSLSTHLDSLIGVIKYKINFFLDLWDKLKLNARDRAKILDALIEHNPYSIIKHFNLKRFSQTQINRLQQLAIQNKWNPAKGQANYRSFNSFVSGRDSEKAFLSTFSDKLLKTLSRNISITEEVVFTHRMRALPSKYLPEFMHVHLNRNASYLAANLTHFPGLNDIPQKNMPQLTAKLLDTQHISWDKIIQIMPNLKEKSIHQLWIGACLESSSCWKQICVSSDSKLFYLNKLIKLEKRQLPLSSDTDSQPALTSPFLEKVLNACTNSSSDHEKVALLSVMNLYSLLCLNYEIDPKKFEECSENQKTLDAILSLRSPKQRNICLNKLLSLSVEENIEKRQLFKNIVGKSTQVQGKSLNIKMLLSCLFAHILKDESFAIENLNKCLKLQILNNTPDLLMLLNCLGKTCELPNNQKIKNQWLKEITQYTNSQDSKRELRQSLQNFQYMSLINSTKKALKKSNHISELDLVSKYLALPASVFEGFSPKDFLDNFGKFRNPLAIQSYVNNLKINPKQLAKESLPLTEKFIRAVMKGTFEIERYQTEHLDIVFKYYPEQKSKWTQSLSLSKEDLEELGIPFDWSVIDTDNPNDILLCGTEVSGSCMSVYKKSFNHGLITYLMDGKYRLFAVKNAAGIIVSRKLVRLMWDQDDKKIVLYEEDLYGNKDSKYEEALKRIALKKAQSMNTVVCKASYWSKYVPYPNLIHSLGGPAPYEWTDTISDQPGSKYSHKACTIE